VNIPSFLEQYVGALGAVAVRGDAREESYYSCLVALISAAAVHLGDPNVSITTQPSKTVNGNPDFRVWRGTTRVLGYVEAKRPDVDNLSVVEGSEQVRRYREAFPNFLLTNFLEFRLYRNGERIMRVEAVRPMTVNKLRVDPPLEAPAELLELLRSFIEFAPAPAASAEELAVNLAKRTRYLRAMVEARFDVEMQGDGGVLVGFYEAFRQFLIGDLTPADFADLYAQTITYGLFAARTRADGSFTRRSAFDVIPKTIGILRDLFRFMSLDELPNELAWIVDDIADLLAASGRDWHFASLLYRWQGQ